MVSDAFSRQLKAAVPAATSGSLEAVLFDMDGVVVDTARLHAGAWKEVFDTFLDARAQRSGEPFRPFDIPGDYNAYVDGRPRHQGVQVFLGSRGIELPWGEEDDGPDRETVCGIANRKNRLFHALLEAAELRPFPGTLRLIAALRRAGLRVAVFSASRNAEEVLRRSEAAHLFDARVDGTDLARLGLAGKPDPAMLFMAAERLGSAPEHAAVIEDSVAGIEAGRRGGFAQRVGIDRGGNARALREAGADLLAQDLGELTLGADRRLAVRTLATLPLAWEACDDLRARMARKRTFVFLDYDGTLTPIVPDPDKAFLPDRMRAALATLSRRCKVAVISGRDLAVIRNWVALPGLAYAGSHGFEVAGIDGRHAGLEQGVEFLPALDAAEAALREELAAIPGHLVERQRFAIAVHYRHASEADAERIGQVVDRVLNETGRLRKGAGKKVFRIQPAIDWDKGRAVLWLLDRLGGDEASLPVYVGDDVTDEDAFRAVALRGLGIVVRGEEDRPTSADLALADTEDVRRFLEFLATACAAQAEGAP